MQVLACSSALCLKCSSVVLLQSAQMQHCRHVLYLMAVREIVLCNALLRELTLHITAAVNQWL
jgi:hypothetical protein